MNPHKITRFLILYPKDEDVLLVAVRDDNRLWIYDLTQANNCEVFLKLHSSLHTWNDDRNEVPSFCFS